MFSKLEDIFTLKRYNIGSSSKGVDIMLTVKGKHGQAKCFVNELEVSALNQIKQYLDQEAFIGSNLRIMPDVHAGAGCVIGFTSKLIDRVVPNIVGVDIGCGVLVVNMGKLDIDFIKLDNFIKDNIPHGFSVNNKKKSINSKLTKRMEKTSRRVGSDYKRDLLSIGSLGGGNHFIEVAVDEDKNKYLLVHSGSRNFGYKVAEYHQRKAKEYCASESDPVYKVPKPLAFLEGKLKDEYLEDMQVALDMADANRKAIAKEILGHLGFSNSKLDSFSTIHNYIDLEGGFIRKGAISAYEGERMVIPWNMRDGSVIAIGKGEKEWNYSAPHGAGRILSRKAAKQQLSMSKFISQMQGVYTTSVNKSTLDESPEAYKDSSEILAFLNQTASLEKVLKPIYNFKAN